MTARPARRALARRATAGLSGLVLVAGAALAGCSSDSVPEALGGEADQSPAAGPAGSAARVSVNVPRKGQVAVDKRVTVTADDGTLRRVVVTGAGAELPGSMSDDGTRWTAEELLEPGTRYRVVGVAEDADGQTKRLTRAFRTQDLTLDQQTYPSLAPLDGETVGVGMPVILTFDIPVTNRKAVERRLTVTSKPAQPGTWHWISDSEVHYRPKSYWKPGTKVTVDADVNGVDAGNGIYGQEDRRTTFTVGDRIVMKVDVGTHTMKVLQNGTLLRTLPISAGKPGFTTRSGVKVIIEKHRYKDMDAATTGISEGDAEYYNLENVEYAMRVTYSGEFIHAAPWSVGSQGSANVSHGCVGLSTENAAWLYNLSKRGDIVDVVGSDRAMEPTNGYGDWNVSWPDYRAGSALS